MTKRDYVKTPWMSRDLLDDAMCSEYYRLTESYDLKHCSGRGADGEGRPIDRAEFRLSNDNAVRVLKELEGKYGINYREIKKMTDRWPVERYLEILSVILQGESKC